MRIDFQNGGSTQSAVTPAQTQMRNARAPKRPVLRVVILLLVLGGGAYGAWWYTRLDTVYTWGLVAARMTPYYAPFEGVVSDLKLERGDYVSNGDALFTLTSVQPENIREAQDALILEIDRQKSIASDARANVVAQAQKEVDRLRAAHEADVTRKQAAVDVAQAELQKQQDIYTMRADQAKRVQELFSLGAAVRSDVEAADDAARVAKHNRDQAQVALTAANNQNVASTAELERAELELERLQNVNPEDATALERGRVELAVAQTRPAPVTVKSLFDGIVMEVGAMDGAQVESGRVVATLATRNDVWVEAYVPPNQAKAVKAGAKAQVFIPGVVEPVDGTIAADSGSAIRVPEILRDKLPTMMMGIYARVNFTPPEGTPIVAGSRVRVVIPK